MRMEEPSVADEVRTQILSANEDGQSHIYDHRHDN